MEFRRYMRVNEFARAVSALGLMRGGHVGDHLLEAWDALGVLKPRIRLRWPDTIARRIWKETHEHIPCQMKLPVEPDGAAWETAIELDDALHRWQRPHVYELSTHPLDEPAPKFAPFIEYPHTLPFQRWLERRVDVSNDVYETLYDDVNVSDYYSGWQILLAAEIADAGIHIPLNLSDEAVFREAEEAMKGGCMPPKASYSFNLMPVHARRDFTRHEAALDAIVWFSEERLRVLSAIKVEDGRRRFRLSDEQLEHYETRSRELAAEAWCRFRIDGDALVAAMRFLAEYWSAWNRLGRPLVASAYKDTLSGAVILARYFDGTTFSQLKVRVGNVGGWFKPIFDVIWPDWAEDEQERARLTLKGIMRSLPDHAPRVTEQEIDGFVSFLATNGLEAFFWRLRSFEEHDLRGNEFASQGMRSDIQGMAIVVEHLTRTLGAKGEQIYDGFKSLWGPEIARSLARSDVTDLARNGRYKTDWALFKRDVAALRGTEQGELLADLVTAQRLRGAVHEMLPEDDHLELEALFVGLMRAAVYTYAEVKRHRPAAPDRLPSETK